MKDLALRWCTPKWGPLSRKRCAAIRGKSKCWAPCLDVKSDDEKGLVGDGQVLNWPLKFEFWMMLIQSHSWVPNIVTDGWGAFVSKPQSFHCDSHLRNRLRCDAWCRGADFGWRAPSEFQASPWYPTSTHVFFPNFTSFPTHQYQIRKVRLQNHSTLRSSTDAGPWATAVSSCWNAPVICYSECRQLRAVPPCAASPPCCPPSCRPWSSPWPPGQRTTAEVWPLENCVVSHGLMMFYSRYLEMNFNMSRNCFSLEVNGQAPGLSNFPRVYMPEKLDFADQFSAVPRRDVGGCCWKAMAPCRAFCIFRRWRRHRMFRWKKIRWRSQNSIPLIKSMKRTVPLLWDLWES